MPKWQSQLRDLEVYYMPKWQSQLRDLEVYYMPKWQSQLEDLHVYNRALQVASDGRLSRKFHAVHSEVSSGCESAGVSLRIPLLALLLAEFLWLLQNATNPKHSHLQAFIVKHAIINNLSKKYILSYLIKRPISKAYRRNCEALQTYQ